MAERGRFELPVELPPRLISSQVHSTTLPPLRSAERAYARNASVTNLRFRVIRCLWKPYSKSTGNGWLLNDKVLCVRMVYHDS